MLVEDRPRVATATKSRRLDSSTVIPRNKLHLTVHCGCLIGEQNGMSEINLSATGNRQLSARTHAHGLPDVDSAYAVADYSIPQINLPEFHLHCLKRYSGCWYLELASKHDGRFIVHPSRRTEAARLERRRSVQGSCWRDRGDELFGKQAKMINFYEASKLDLRAEVTTGNVQCSVPAVECVRHAILMQWAAMITNGELRIVEGYIYHAAP